MRNIFDLISLNQGEENHEKVLENVTSNISFRGSNLWILACAIVVASVGLNVNSAAVIIGAMLISPLMGPIVGAGFGLGIFDFDLLRTSLKNLLIATVVSLTVATLYFTLSPFKETQSELLARTSPNIYDVMIAFFGGLVGVIAITRVEKGNPIPGVAIATALMPPLCTAGYGLATGNLNFFLGALYLYTINCVFICISTFLIVKYLKYAPVKYISEKNAKRMKYIITLLIMVLILPSFYLAYTLFNQKKYKQKVDAFIQMEFTANGYTVIYKNVNFTSNPRQIEVALLAKKFTAVEITRLNEKLADYQLTNTELKIKQDTTDLKNLILKEINGEKAYINQKDLRIIELEKALAAQNFDNPGILNETKILFPSITQLSIANHAYYTQTDSSKNIPVMVYESENELSDADKTKLTGWLLQKLKISEIYLVRKTPAPAPES